jgi:hypothetical protein
MTNVTVPVSLPAGISTSPVIGSSGLSSGTTGEAGAFPFTVSVIKIGEHPTQIPISRPTASTTRPIAMPKAVQVDLFNFFIRIQYSLLQIYRWIDK